MIRLSWSGLRTHEECRQRGYLTRMGNRATLADTRGYFPGKVTDRVVRNWLLDDPMNNIGAMPDMVSSVMESERAEIAAGEQGVLRWKQVGDKAIIEAECIDAVTKIEPLLLREVVPFDYDADFHFEAPVEMRLRGGQRALILLNGYMDIIVRDDKGQFRVWDVKHTRDNDYWRKTVGQLGFYDLAVELKFGQPTVMTGLLQPLCEERVKPYYPSADSRSQLLQRIQAMAYDVKNEVKTPRPDASMCGYCDVKHACSKFEPVMDSRGRKKVPF